MAAVLSPSRPTRDASPAQRRRAQRERFLRLRVGEGAYARQLKQVAEQVGALVKGLAPDGVVEDLPELEHLLNRYAELMHPWARKVAGRMLADVGQRDQKAWIAAGREIGRELGREVREADTGQVTAEMLDLQVDLITSLPRQAAQRVHELTLKGMEGGVRAAELSEEILRSGDVTKSRAMLIARTEVARTAFEFTRARALKLGSEAYVWRTSLDSDVRRSHRQMEGKIIAWDDAPTLSDNTTTHAGCIYNCRCWAEPILPDEV